MSITFSNKNSVIRKDKEFYSDFYVNLDAHPDNNQLVRHVNEKAIIRSIKNLLLTNRYERLFQPEIGGNIRRLLFEPITPISTSSLKTFIEETINRYEPRAGLLDVIVTPYEEKNLYVVSISFFIGNAQETTSFTIQLSRVR